MPQGKKLLERRTHKNIRYLLLAIMLVVVPAGVMTRADSSSEEFSAIVVNWLVAGPITGLFFYFLMPWSVTRDTKKRWIVISLSIVVSISTSLVFNWCMNKQIEYRLQYPPEPDSSCPACFNDPLKDWVLTEPLDINIRNDQVWYVHRQEGGDIIITTVNKKPEAYFGSRVSFTHTCPYGRFVGFNFGEFGGRLLYIPQGKETSPDSHITVRIEGRGIDPFRSPDGVFQLGDEYYAMGGISWTSVISILPTAEGVRVVKSIAHIKEDLKTYVCDDESVYIVTNESLWKLSKNHSLSRLIENAFWKGRSPNSIVVIGSHVLIGMTGCVASVNIEDKTVSCYTLPDRSTTAG